MDALGLFENADELDSLLAWQAGTGRELRPVALTPAADHAADTRRLRCPTIEDYYDETALIEGGLANYDRLHAFARWLDGRYAEAFPDDRKTAWFSVFHYIYHLKVSLDGVYHRGHTLGRLLDATAPRTVVGFAGVSGPPRRDAVFYRHPFRSLATAVLPALCRARGIAWVALPAPPVPPPDAAPPTPLPGEELWQHLIGQADRIRAAGNSLKRIVVRGPYWSDREPFAALPSHGHSAVPVEAVAAGSPDPDPVDAEAGRALWAAVRGAAAFRDLFTVDGVDLSATAHPVFETFLTDIVPRQRLLARRIAERLQRLGDAAVVVSSPVDPLAVAAVVGARRAGRPSFVVQHGGLWYFDSAAAAGLELQLSDWYLAYGDGVVRHAAEALRPDPAWPRVATPVVTGGPSLQTIHRARPPVAATRHPERGVRLLCAFTGLTGDTRYFSRVLYPDIWYARHQRDLIRRCVAMEGVELTLRPYPDDPHNPLGAWLAAERPRCRVAWTVPFADLVGDADLIVIDFPSTVLLQAAASAAQLVVMGDRRFFHFDPEARALLQRRAWVTDTRAGLFAAIDEAVAACRAGRGKPLDDAFLARYGVDPGRDATAAMVEAVTTLPARPDQHA